MGVLEREDRSLFPGPFFHLTHAFMGWNTLIQLVHKDQRCFPGHISFCSHCVTPPWLVFQESFAPDALVVRTFLRVWRWRLSSGLGKGKKRKKGKMLSPKWLTELDALVMEQDEPWVSTCHVAAGQESDIREQGPGSWEEGRWSHQTEGAEEWNMALGAVLTSAVSSGGDQAKGSKGRLGQQSWDALKIFAKLAPVC